MRVWGVKPTRGQKKKDKSTFFVAMTWELLNSKAYKKLPHTAKGALPYFLGKPKKFVQDPLYYRDVFIFPYAEAKTLGYAKKTFYRVIDALFQYGFIDLIEIGGLRSSGKTTSKFKLSNRWKDYGFFNFVKADRRKVIEKQIQH
jgi:hypothetical protein